MSTLKQIEEKAMHAVRYGEELRPQRDWSVLLILAGLMLIASITVSAWTFIRVTQGQPVGTDGSRAGNAASDIENVRALFKERRAEETRYRSEYQFVDPS